MAAKVYHAEGIFFQAFQKENRPDAFYHDANLGLAIIADARIFNRHELINLLAVTPSISDVHLILLSYKKWGVAAVEKIIGDFTFAIWDQRSQQLFLACDPFGQRAWYYSHAANYFCFSNFVQPLFEQGRISRALNSSDIVAAFFPLIREVGQTFFKYIKCLQPGHYLILKHSHLYTQRYWSADHFKQNPLIYSDAEDYFQHFLQSYRETINEYLNLVPGKIGSHLSGGLDSSSVTSMAAHLLQKKSQKLYAYSHIPTTGVIAHPKKNYNYCDKLYIQTVAELYPNIELMYIQDSEQKLFSYNNKLNPWLARPVLTCSNLIWLMKIIESAQAQGIHTLLTGQGGNGTVSWKGAPPVKAIKNLKAYLGKFKRRLQHWKNPTAGFSVINPRLLHELNVIEKFKQRLESMQSQSSDVNLMQIFNYGITLTAASYQAAVRLLYDVEHWDPTLDRRIVEFCLRVPNKIHRFLPGGRSLVRKSLEGIMPKIICDRLSRGMQAADWYKKIEVQKHEFITLLNAWKGTHIEEYINLDFLLAKMQQWDFQRISTSKDKRYQNYESMYSNTLLPAIEIGLFIQHQNGFK